MADNREVLVPFRVSPEEKRLLEMVARSQNMGLSAFIRWASVAVATGITTGHGR